MIVPQNRLLLWTAVVLLPLALLAGVDRSTLLVSAAGAGIFIAVVLMDALRSPALLAGLGVELPETVRMSKDREAKIDVRVRNPTQRALTLRLGLPWPVEIEPENGETEIALPSGAEWSSFPWSCKPRKRGRYTLDTVYLETGSAFGFWAVRRKLPALAQFHVYPNLLADRKSLAELFLHRGSFGLHNQRQIGKGREFEKLREYVGGDSYEDIHWKATAKRGRPVTKVFQIERTQEVYVILDASRLSARTAGTQATPGISRDAVILERFITASLVLGLAAEQQGDLFGLLTFTDKVERFVRAKNGKAHYNSCRDALYTLQPRAVTPDFDEVCTFLRLRLRRRALLIFLTSLDDPVVAESFVRNLELIRRQHLVIVNMVQPPGVAPAFSQPAVASMDEIYQQLGGHLLWQKLRELEKVLQRRGVAFSLLKNERLSADLVSQYLTVKKRQLI